MTELTFKTWKDCYNYLWREGVFDYDDSKEDLYKRLFVQGDEFDINLGWNGYVRISKG